MRYTWEIIKKYLTIFCCIAVVAACAPVKTVDMAGDQGPAENVAVKTVDIAGDQGPAESVPIEENLENNIDYVWGISSIYPEAENGSELEEKLQGDVEPEPEQTVDQEVQDLELLGTWEQGVPAPENPAEEITYDFPVTVNRQVQYYLDFFSGKHRGYFAVWLARSGRYLPMIHEQLRNAGLPDDLVYLAMIESGFSERAYSRARAVGVWQFIKGTGRKYGLEINTYVDERRDPIKSTQAAVSYLRDLYDEFGSWYLAVAAYNAGEGKIRKAISKYKTTDFWEIAQGKYLKLETKRYVPKLIAAIIIAKEPEKYGFENIEYAEPLAFETVEVPRWTALKAVAMACDIDTEDLKSYNRELRKEFTPPNRSSYPFKVPVGKKGEVEKKLPRVQAVVSTRFKTHTVDRGETLDSICRRYGLTKTVLLKSNNLQSLGLTAGQRLQIPYQTTSYEMLPEGSRAKDYLAAQAEGGKFILHKIRPGETVYELSRLYNVPVHLIAAWNDLADISRIRAGQQLVFYVQHNESRVAAIPAATRSVKQFAAPTAVTKTDQGGAEGRLNQVQTTAVRNDLPVGDSGRYYVVKDGDSLWEIARQYDLDPADLKRFNGLATNVIYPGDRLLLAGEQLAVAQLAGAQPTEAEFYYHVRRGDSLWTIARKYNLSPQEIKRWNNLSNDLIHPGKRLLLRVADSGESGDSFVDTFYQVRRGDSLWTIARRHNISPEEIKKWNNLKDNTIYPGNRLLLKIASGG